MARKPGFNLPGVSQHVIQRGNNREPFFYQSGIWILSGLFIDVCQEADYLVHAYHRYWYAHSRSRCSIIAL